MDRQTYEKGLALAKTDRFAEALDVFSTLRATSPDSPLLAASIANVHWNLDNVEAAIQFYREALKLKPDFEVAVLGLIHCLLIRNEKTEAVAEARRFSLTAFSNEVAMILAELEK